MAKTQDFLKLLAKQSQLDCLDTVFLTIGACKVSYPVCCHEAEYCFGMLIAYSLCLPEDVGVNYLMSDHQFILLDQKHRQ